MTYPSPSNIIINALKNGVIELNITLIFKRMMIHDRKFIYTIIPLTGLLLIASAVTPGLVLAERIPFAVQNVTQSAPAELVEGLFQIAILLPQRDDGKFYAGQLTYTSSAPLEVNVLQPQAANVSGP